MKLLLDQNLSHRLIARLFEDFKGSVHVRDVNLSRASDVQVWEFAARNGFIIMSKDADFHQRSFLFGHPPKVVWIKSGNCTSEEILAVIVRHRADLEAFAVADRESFLVLR